MRRKITLNQIHLDLYQYNSARTNVDPLLTFFKIDTQQIVSKIFKCENGENPSDTKNCEICDKHTIEQANQKFSRKAVNMVTYN